MAGESTNEVHLTAFLGQLAASYSKSLKRLQKVHILKSITLSEIAERHIRLSLRRDSSPRVT